MPFPPIAKPAAWITPPNLLDYDAARRDFSWEQAATELAWLPGGRLNLGHEAVGRHANGPEADRCALRWLGKRGERRELTYRELDRLSQLAAGGLERLGVRPGTRVFTLAGRIPELYVTALGALKAGAVVCPLFSAFGPEPVYTRLTLGEGAVLLTTPALYQKRVAALRPRLPKLEHVLLAGATGEAPSGTLPFDALLSTPGSFATRGMDPEAPALLHFTSGTTGTPKGALHVHRAILAHRVTARLALDLRPDDVFWCTADPGWVTGTSYGILAPLALGATLVVDEAEFDPERWYRLLEEERVTNWYTAPTAVRMLMKAGPELARARDLSRLRFIASVGEPLNPEAVLWGSEVFGRPIHDNWWQTETGGIMIANFAACEVRPGSMGRPLPGIEAAILRRDEAGQVIVRQGQPEVVTEAGVEGELALRTGWPSMFRGYLHQEERYRRCFVGGWYLSGDLAKRDADGYFWFVGRGDDVIKCAGHLIGPFEVESALMEHPAVAEVGVIGKPDPVAGALIKAFVALKRGFEPTDELARELLGFARTRLGPAVAPKEISFAAQLPRTRSGKIMRRLLKARELGLPDGDLSTLEQTEKET
ncbi:MAG: acetate--CoA ligase [Deltaproteobacteria bacterium]|nr:acetate--CoA ligase [Deltaproteobacteria bacterium]